MTNTSHAVRISYFDVLDKCEGKKSNVVFKVPQSYGNQPVSHEYR